jgi:SCF-associated factor 1
VGNDQPLGSKIVKVAAGDNFIIALTEGGHVLKVDFSEGIESFRRRLQPLRWQYVSCNYINYFLTGINRPIARGV